MPLNNRGFTVVEVPELQDAVTETFNHMPLDQYSGGKHRTRRFSQYKMNYNDREWKLELLPARPFMQSKEYNVLVGGIPRNFKPLEFNPEKQIAVGAMNIPLPIDREWQINVHQCRVRTNQEIKGVSVPEGPHRDGHEYGMVIVFGRKNIEGGVTQLLPNGGGDPFFEVELQENNAIVYDDGRMFHYATDIIATEEIGGYRDLWIVAYNEWKNRRYGSNFEARANQ